jgi:uncharacterized protein
MAAGSERIMRLTKEECSAIVASIAKFDRAAEVYLFGSRTDDGKKGGDIDLLIRSDVLGKGDLWRIEEELFKRIDEQKVDFVFTSKSSSNSFAEMILAKGAVRLCPSKN